LDDLSQGLHQANVKVCDVQQQKKTAEETLDQLADQKSLLDEFQVATTTRDDEFRE
jgi:hypothetical protein